MTCTPIRRRGAAIAPDRRLDVPAAPGLERRRLRLDLGDAMRKAVLGLFVALAAVLAVAPLAGADQVRTVACCGPTPPGWP
jgi:hypothetical protein